MAACELYDSAKNWISLLCPVRAERSRTLDGAPLGAERLKQGLGLITKEIVMPNAMARAIVLGGMLVAGTTQAAETVAAAPPSGLLQRIEHQLNQTPTLSRFMVNECLLAATAAMVVAAVSTGPIAPAVSASLGVAPGLSVFTIGGLACGAGAAAAVVVAGVWTTWSERQVIAEAAEARVVALLNSAESLSVSIRLRPMEVVGERPMEVVGERLDVVARFLSAIVPTGWHIRDVPLPDAGQRSGPDVGFAIRQR